MSRSVPVEFTVQLEKPFGIILSGAKVTSLQPDSKAAQWNARPENARRQIFPGDEVVAMSNKKNELVSFAGWTNPQILKFVRDSTSDVVFVRLKGTRLLGASGATSVPPPSLPSSTPSLPPSAAALSPVQVLSSSSYTPSSSPSFPASLNPISLTPASATPMAYGAPFVGGASNPTQSKPGLAPSIPNAPVAAGGGVTPQAGAAAAFIINTYYRVAFDFKATDASELNASKGDMVYIFQLREGGWCLAAKPDGQAGWLPTSYLKQKKAGVASAVEASKEGSAAGGVEGQSQVKVGEGSQTQGKGAEGVQPQGKGGEGAAQAGAAGAGGVELAEETNWDENPANPEVAVASSQQSGASSQASGSSQQSGSK